MGLFPLHDGDSPYLVSAAHQLSSPSPA